MPATTRQPLIKRLRAAVHVAARKRGLIEDTPQGPDKSAYLALLAEHFHATTSSALNEAQLLTLLDLINGRIGAPAPDPHRPACAEDSPQLRKIDAQLRALGKRWAYAIGIAKQMYGRERIEWCTGPELGGIITALSQHQRREARR